MTPPLFPGRVPKTIAALALLAAFGPLTPTPSALGYNEFQKVFLKHYAGRENPEFRQVVRKAKCYLCHQGEEDRKNCNRYGVAMTPHLGEEDKKDKEKILAVLLQIAEEPSDPSDSAAPTFGELIAAGELPGGPLEECKKEPESSPEGGTKDGDSA